MLLIVFVMSLIGLVALLGLNYSGRFGNFLAHKGMIGSVARGMAGVFSFFIVTVLLIWTVSVMIIIALAFVIITFFGFKFKKSGFSWTTRKNTEFTDNGWSGYKSAAGEIRTITLDTKEWKDVTPKKKTRKKKAGKNATQPDSADTPPENKKD